MEASEAELDARLNAGDDVYGVTRGFGPLVGFAADRDDDAQGLNLVHHLAVGQDPVLAPEPTKVLLWLRLNGMRRGYSAIAPKRWYELAEFVNGGFLPVVPTRGNVSASGDLVPLAHAALAMAGRGMAWRQVGHRWTQIAAEQALDELGLLPIRWGAREALAFVNGSSASLALALFNHVEALKLTWSVCALTGRVVTLLGASTEPYAAIVAEARGGSPGQRQAAAWVREHTAGDRRAREARALQERYSLRCVPQIAGAVLDYLWASEDILLREASGCSDNPVIGSDGVFHAGNFHAIGAGLASDLHLLVVHQLAFVAERQLALLVDPSSNGGRPILLAHRPGATSGVAGLQLAATGMLAEIRQRTLPATVTALPTNLSNQDVVPMSLNGAMAVSEVVRVAGLILGSLAIVVSQWEQAGPRSDAGTDAELWAGLRALSPRLTEDRPLSEEIRQAAALLTEAAADACAGLAEASP
jgi:histidine ammonia-lyase